MNIPVREGETIEGSRTMRNRPYPVLKCSSQHEFARVVKCNRICPNGKVQLLHLVKVARVVSGEKTKAEMWPQELKVNIPSGYDYVNLIWSSRG